MSKAKQTDHLKELLKPDIVINLDKRVTSPFDLLHLQAQLNQISDASTSNQSSIRSSKEIRDPHKIIGMGSKKRSVSSSVR